MDKVGIYRRAHACVCVCTLVPGSSFLLTCVRPGDHGKILPSRLLVRVDSG